MRGGGRGNTGSSEVCDFFASCSSPAVGLGHNEPWLQVDLAAAESGIHRYLSCPSLPRKHAAGSCLELQASTHPYFLGLPALFRSTAVLIAPGARHSVLARGAVGASIAYQHSGRKRLLEPWR